METRCPFVGLREPPHPISIAPDRRRLSAPRYINTLRHSPLGPAREAFPCGDWTVQQDGAPCHTGKITQRWLREQGVTFIPRDSWPPNSPDLNPIEGYWELMKQQMDRRRPTTMRGFKRAIVNGFRNCAESLGRLIDDSLPKLQTVLERGGAAV